ncbi:unnamed protein product [Linum trigynum]|uniref:Uncharacterized protein n=1 Tax=Linum trigynum TaxID=586398 RepID=A0AAV2E463_9ROSI
MVTFMFTMGLEKIIGIIIIRSRNKLARDCWPEKLRDGTLLSSSSESREMPPLNDQEGGGGHGDLRTTTRSTVV